MENIRGPPGKLLMESMLEKNLKKYGLRLFQGEKRYRYTPEYSYRNGSFDSNGVCQKKTSEKAMKLKIHPLSKANISYELIWIYNMKKGG